MIPAPGDLRPLVFTLVVIACALFASFRALRWAFVVAQPDEWLLRIRNGALIDAGVGISLLRRPGDVVVRFSSTVQRVKFIAPARTAEQLPVTLEGFVLWSVAREKSGPLRAYSKLGIANLDHPPPELKSKKHLLTSAQHHAFQALLCAEVQRHTASLALSEILVRQKELVVGLTQRLTPLFDALGIHIEELEILEVRPSDASLLRDLSAREEQAVREQAAKVRIEVDRTLKAREEEIVQERKLAAEAAQMKLQAARLEREERDLAARLDQIRREAAARRDAMLEINAAEEQKSQAVRDHELSCLVSEKATEALRALPIKDARWISVGGGSPASSLAALVAGVREVVLEARTRTPPS